MIEKSFFKNIKVLDGGMGQELLSKGLKAKGSLWSASALIEEKYHQLVVDTHLDFINAGANVIVTNNFSARRARMIENKVNNLFSYANEKAGELAVKSKELSNKEIMIAGSLPAQNDTYIQDYRDVKIIEENFNDQAQCLKSYVDFYYLDVLSSSLECEIALNAISQIGLSTLVGLHVKSDNRLPSGETITEVVNKCKKFNIIGIILSCVSPEIVEKNVDELNLLDIPYGFKVNLWKKKDPLPHTAWIKKPDQIGTNPIEVLGTRHDYTEEMFLNFSKKMIQKGAENLLKILKSLGASVEITLTPKNILHFKSECSLIEEDTILLTQNMTDNNIFKKKYNLIKVPKGEEIAANSIRINNNLLIPSGCPETEKILSKNYNLISLNVDELFKIDAGLSCMSLRW